MFQESILLSKRICAVSPYCSTSFTFYVFHKVYLLFCLVFVFLPLKSKLIEVRDLVCLVLYIYILGPNSALHRVDIQQILAA